MRHNQNKKREGGVGTLLTYGSAFIFNIIWAELT